VKPQTLAVLALLREFGDGGVTPSEARDIVGTDRLAARIWELRAEGFDVETTHWTTPRGKKTVARYILRERTGQLGFTL
jgi:hypothetical protein